MENNYKEKYLKYKTKYLELRAAMSKSLVIPSSIFRYEAKVKLIEFINTGLMYGSNLQLNGDITTLKHDLRFVIDSNNVKDGIFTEVNNIRERNSRAIRILKLLKSLKPTNEINKLKSELELDIFNTTSQIKRGEKILNILDEVL